MAGRPKGGGRKSSSISKKKQHGSSKAERRVNAAKAAAKATKRTASNATNPTASEQPSKKQREYQEVARSNADAPIVEDDNGALELAADLMLNLPPGIWWHVLQDFDGELDVATAARQEWSLIVPVYIKSRLFQPPAANSNKLQFNRSRWDELILFIKHRNNIKLQVEPLRQKGKSAVYCVTIGTKRKSKPKFSSTIEQMRMTLKKGMEALGIRTGGDTVDDLAMTQRLQHFRDEC